MNTDGYTLTGYAIYAVTVTTCTLLVSRLIFRHGRAFILRGYENDEALTDGTLGMLRTQFNLTAIAAMSLLMRFSHDGSDGFLSTERPRSGAELFEVLGVKIGLMLLIVGGMHFLTLRLINRIRRNGAIF